MVSAIISEWAMLGIMTDGPTEGWKSFGGCFVILMWVSFVLGLVSAVVFSLQNLFQL